MPHEFPYTNFHELNLDFVLKYLKNMFGGRAGQVIKKLSSTDMDFEWGNLTAEEVGALPDTYSPPVRSVNGKTGDVNITAQDIGALPGSYSPPVESVNGKTGEVELTASDVQALPDSYSPPVTSVNGKIGAVVLRAADVFALPSNYQAPVDSVNGKTGRVVLTYSDVGALPESYVPPVTKQDLIDMLPTVTTTEDYALSFRDGANNLPVLYSSLRIPAVQSGEGDPSPDNVRHFVGINSATITHTKANVFGGIDFARSFEGTNGYALDETTETFIFKRRGGSSSKIIFGGPFCHNTVYTMLLTCQCVGTNTSLSFVYTDGTNTQITINNPDKETLVRRSSAGKTIKYISLGWSQVSTTTVWYNESGIFVGEDIEPADYAAYYPTTIPIDMSSIGPVYAGIVNINTGQVQTYPFYSSYNGETLTGPWLSSMDVYDSAISPTVGAQVIDMGGAMTSHSIDPVTISTYYGSNNFLCDEGYLQLTYKADIQKYIDWRLS